MNRNVEAHFAELPQVDIQRSIFDLSRDHKMSFNVGELVPFYCNTDILPGDTFNVTTSIVARLQTLQTPIMSDVFMDTYWFFIPWRLVYDHFAEFMGENKSSAWIPQTEYSLPIVRYPVGGFAVGTIADHLGIPTGVAPEDDRLCMHVGGVRAYALTANEWFRDQNLTDPINVPTGDANQQGSNGSDYINDVANGGKPFLVAKYHDPYTSMLPSPQKSQPINIFGNQIDNTPATVPGTVHQIPVYAGADPSAMAINAGNPAKYNTVKKDGTIGSGDWYNFRTSSSANIQGKGINDVAASDLMFYPTNLYADATMLDLSINELRLAFQLQRYYERQARGGSRYREYIKEFFNVNSPDARMMIPEYLGGHRFPLSIHQVANQSSGEDAFLGDLGAMSNTMDVHDDFIKSFSEHGILLGLACCRYEHSYPQGIEMQWLRRDKLDFYTPVFANIGEQGVPRACVYLGNDSNRDDIMGYQEAWFEYRMSPDFVSGELRPGIQNSLANWHLADYYAEEPHLSDAWIREDKSNVDRVLQVTSAAANQIFCDFYAKITATRPLPVYSIPGLIDHH